jgi:transposase
VTELKLIAIDTSKYVFTLHGVNDRGVVVLRRDLRRSQLEGFFRKLPPTELVLEACGGSHHWGRTLAAWGHRVRLVPPQYVKPFVKRGKNDRTDAEAISEAASRASMRFVPVKSVEQQAAAMVVSVRELLVKQHTQLVNAVRGHAAEFGVIAAKGTWHVAALLARIADDLAIPAAAQAMFVELGEQIAALHSRLAELDRALIRQHKTNPVSQQLAEVPGIGPIGALTVDASQFQSGRHFAAWLGRSRTRPAASRGWAGSRVRAMSGCVSCWSSAPPRSSDVPSLAAGLPAHGCWDCCSGGRGSSPQWLWPTRWPVSCGP